MGPEGPKGQDGAQGAIGPPGPPSVDTADRNAVAALNLHLSRLTIALSDTRGGLAKDIQNVDRDAAARDVDQSARIDKLAQTLEELSGRIEKTSKELTTTSNKLGGLRNQVEGMHSRAYVLAPGSTLKRLGIVINVSKVDEFGAVRVYCTDTAGKEIPKSALDDVSLKTPEIEGVTFQHDRSVYSLSVADVQDRPLWLRDRLVLVVRRMPGV
jgi:hypothetical protein